MKPADKFSIYFRESLAEESELAVARKYFNVINQRALARPATLVIPRYSSLPYYKELEEDLKIQKCKLINTFRQHCYVADMMNWYYDLKDYTPKTWFNFVDIPEHGNFVLKGQTNSRKHLWNSHMFASGKKDAINVCARLSQDSMIGWQSIYVREFVPLRTFYKGINGLPVAEEYRFFVYKEKILSSGFYWSDHEEEIKERLDPNVDPNVVPKDFLKNIISIASKNIDFFVVDVARTENDEWILIELNDGTMSGLSCCSAELLYSSLRKELLRA